MNEDVRGIVLIGIVELLVVYFIILYICELKK